MSNESDVHKNESSTQKPSHPGEPDEMPLTLGTNGGGREDDQPAGTDQGRAPRGTEAPRRDRKAS